MGKSPVFIVQNLHCYKSHIRPLALESVRDAIIALSSITFTL